MTGLASAPLTVEADTATPSGAQLDVMDDNKNPVACRMGIWVGLEEACPPLRHLSALPDHALFPEPPVVSDG